MKKIRNPDCKVLEGEQLQALYEKLDLEKNTSTWEAIDTQAKAFEIVHRYSFLFAMDSLDLGRTDLVQHHITLTDYTPIKDWVIDESRLISMMRSGNI